MCQSEKEQKSEREKYGERVLIEAGLEAIQPRSIKIILNFFLVLFVGDQ